MISFKQKFLSVNQCDFNSRLHHAWSSIEYPLRELLRSLRWTHKLIMVVIAFLYIGSFWFQFRVNTTHSLPHYVYLVQKGHLPKKGDFVEFTHPMFQGSVIKRVVGVPGDSIEIRTHNIYIDNCHICPLVDKNSKGEPLIPIEVKAIPRRYYFVSGDHRRSFDSCYQAFGLVHQSQVEGRAWAIF